MFGAYPRGFGHNKTAFNLFHLALNSVESSKTIKKQLEQCKTAPAAKFAYLPTGIQS